MENIENIRIPAEMREKLGPMIVRSMTAKLNESGTQVSEEEIRKLVDDENMEIEVPAVLFRPKKIDPNDLFPTKITCILKAHRSLNLLTLGLGGG